MKTLNDFFDKIYCINLSHRTDRWEKVKNEFKNNSLVVKRVEGVYGKNEVNSTKLLDGAYGIILSNILVFNDAIKNKYEKILIFEDDITFVENINERFWNKISYLPNDWDLLYLGGNNQFNFGKFTMISGDTSAVVTKKTYNTFDYELVKTEWTQCAYAVGYNTKILPNLIKVLKHFREPIDVTLPTYQKVGVYNAYIYFPTLVKTYDNYSDIECRVTDYDYNISVNY